MGNDQIIGTYGEYGNSGSDLNFSDFSQPSSFPADPTPDELAWLTTTTNLSPGCLAQWCQEFDLDALGELMPDFVMLHGYRESAWAISSFVPAIEALGIPIIYNEISLEPVVEGDECTVGNEGNCRGKSMIEVIEQLESVAEFLGHDIPESVQEDKALMCEAAHQFSEYAEAAHDAGVRVLAGYLSLGTSYIADPRHDMVLRMFEELGGMFLIEVVPEWFVCLIG